jgi:predicted glycosyltransferase
MTNIHEATRQVQRVAHELYCNVQLSEPQARALVVIASGGPSREFRTIRACTWYALEQRGMIHRRWTGQTGPAMPTEYGQRLMSKAGQP